MVVVVGFCRLITLRNDLSVLYYVEITAVFKPTISDFPVWTVYMISRQKLIPSFILMMIVSLFLAGCVRPIPDAEATAVPADQDTFDPNIGGGTSLDPTAAPETEGQVAPTEAAPQTETDSVAESDESITDEVVAVETAVVAEIAEAAATPEPATDTAQPEQATEETTTSTETTTTTATCPAEHVVQAGENLYRIGLQYGLSWVTIAQDNGITNPNNITVGQTLEIPCDGTTPPPVEPTSPPVQPTLPPDEVTTYTVQPGDNLFRISLKFGVSWVEIAEANGVVNPNEIYTGQVLKIPTSAPGPRPEFTHIVKQGETVYSISVQYGVPAVAIAEVNGLQEPYVIYAGQTLIIPGNG